MMRRLTFIVFIGIALFVSSCAVNNGLTYNNNNHNTEVVLSENNYQVIDRVKGQSQAMYIFGIGGLSKDGIVAEARADMLSEAGIVGGSKAIINETVEVKYTFFPIVRKYTVTVSGHVVEFTE